ncbi:MAG: caspase family protein [Thermodesulfobacteriota bacterium]
MKKKISYMVLLLVMLSMLLSACASVPVASPEMDMKAKNMTPPPGKALLYVYRSAVFVSSGVLYKIIVDGNTIGALAERTYLTVVLEPGKHRINFGAEHGATPAARSLTVEAGTTYYAELSVFPTDLLMVSEDTARKAMVAYALIYESEEPILVTSAKAKSTNIDSASSTNPTAALKTRSDIDELPAIMSEPKDNAFAVVIGIENYRSLPKSDYSGNDAALVKSYLKSLGFQERNIDFIVDERATKTDVEKSLEAWLPNRATKDSLIIVYFSGHGAPEPATGEAYMVPYDGDPNYLPVTGYPLKRLYARLAKLEAKEIIVVLDSCFSGAGGRSVLAKGTRPLVMMAATEAPPAHMAVLTATQGSQISTSSPDKGHGVFTYYFLKALKDGKKNIAEIYDYLKPLVEDEAKAMNVQQTPSLSPDATQLKKRFVLMR